MMKGKSGAAVPDHHRVLQPVSQELVPRCRRVDQEGIFWNCLWQSSNNIAFRNDMLSPRQGDAGPEQTCHHHIDCHHLAP